MPGISRGRAITAICTRACGANWKLPKPSCKNGWTKLNRFSPDWLSPRVGASGRNGARNLSNTIFSSESGCTDARGGTNSYPGALKTTNCHDAINLSRASHGSGHLESSFQFINPGSGAGLLSICAWIALHILLRDAIYVNPMKKDNF